MSPVGLWGLETRARLFWAGGHPACSRGLGWGRRDGGRGLWARRPLGLSLSSPDDLWATCGGQSLRTALSRVRRERPPPRQRCPLHKAGRGLKHSRTRRHAARDPREAGRPPDRHRWPGAVAMAALGSLFLRCPDLDSALKPQLPTSAWWPRAEGEPKLQGPAGRAWFQNCPGSDQNRSLQEGKRHTDRQSHTGGCFLPVLEVGRPATSLGPTF